MKILNGVTGEEVGKLEGKDVITSNKELLRVVQTAEDAGVVMFVPHDDTSDDKIVDGAKIVTKQDDLYVDALIDYIAGEGFDVVVPAKEA